MALNLFDKQKPSLLNENDYISYFSSLSTIGKDVTDNNKNMGTPIGSIKEPDANSQDSDSNSQKYVYSGLYYIENWSDFSKSKEKKAYSGYYGYAFYYGNKTATDLPVKGVAKYKGTWHFITAAENGKTYPLFSNSSGQGYSKRSAIPADIDLDRQTGLISEFSVDFGKKKLTGGLYYNLRETKANESQKRTHQLYDLEAEVYSNRFRGKVKPTQKESQEHPFTSEGTLEGGFYGPNGQELGGKFLAHDQKVFGVFSAKETPQNPELSRETLIDGKLTTFSTKKTDAKTNATANAATSTAANTTTDTTANTITDAENFKTKDIPSFGEADYLLIDKYPIPLLPEKNTDDFITSRRHKVGDKTYQVEACCNNLSYVKFGMYYEVPLEEEKDKEKDKEKNKEKNKEKQTAATTNTYYQFLLGHRTPKDDIPKTGSAQYRGSWFGYLGDGSTSYSATGDKNALAEFNVDFADKKLTGELKRHDTKNTVFSIEAKFQNGNTFKGTATATNFVIDGNNSQNGNTQINIKTEVNGAFYGPNATELGGYFTYNGNNPTDKNSPTASSSSNSEKARAAVVFGAKKQVEKNNK